MDNIVVLVWEGGGEVKEENEQGAEAAVWSNSSSLALDARRAVRCGARLVRLQWRRADSSNTAIWRDADLTSLHHHREVTQYIFQVLTYRHREGGKQKLPDVKEYTRS